MNFCKFDLLSSHYPKKCSCYYFALQILLKDFNIEGILGEDVNFNELQSNVIVL